MGHLKNPDHLWECLKNDAKGIESLFILDGYLTIESR